MKGLDQMLDHLDHLEQLRTIDRPTEGKAVYTDGNCPPTDAIPYVGYKFASFDGLVSFEEQKRPTSGSRYTYRFDIVCWSCGEEFPSARSTSRTCSPRCRDNLKYVRKGAKKAADEATRQINILSSMSQSPDPVMRERAREALREIARLALDTCSNNGINPHRK